MFLSHLMPLITGRPKHFSELLPWASLIDEGLLWTKDEALLRTYQLHPLDLKKLSITEQGNVMRQLHDAWKRLEAPWGVWIDAHQVQAPIYPITMGSSPVATMVDEEQRQIHNAPGSRWIPDIFLSLWYRPSHQVDSWMSRILYTSNGPRTSYITEAQERFETIAEQWIDLLRGVSHRIDVLDSDAQLTYLHSLVSDQVLNHLDDTPVDIPHPIIAPDPPIHLDYVLADTPLITGTRPMLGTKHLGLISLRSLPNRTKTAMFDELQTMPFAHRQVVRWIPQSRETVTKGLTRRKDNWRSTATSLRGLMYQMMSGEQSHDSNQHVDRQAEDTDTIKDKILSNTMTLGDLTVTIVLAHQDRETLTSQKREVQRILHTHGCTSIDEELNAVDAYMGTLPGLPEANVRQYPVSSWNAIHVSPWSRPWLGQDATTHLHAPPLVIATTHRHLPYGFSPFVDDVANMLMAGPVGSGKTAALGQFALYWLARYTPARLFMFDVKRGARCLVHCLGGHYYQIGRDRVAFQPLAGIDESTERTWACGWIIDRLRDAGIQINGVIQGFVEGAMEMLARMPQSHRTVTGLLEAMDTQSRRLEANSGGAPLHIRQGYLQQHRACREALRPFTAGHTYGYLLDASYDGLMEGDIQCFELQSLLNTPHLVAAVQSYIWHRLYALFQAGIPTLFVMDECGISMKHPRIREDIDQGLRLLRDKLVGFAMATQDVLDFVDRDIGPMLLNNCPTRLLLPNPSATDSTIRTAYEALGLPEHAIKRIAISTPKRQIFVQQRPLGETLIDLPMAPLMRCIAGSSSPEDHARMDEILAKYGPEEFPQQWLIQHGFPKEANTLETMSTHSTMDDDRWRAPRLQRMLAVG